MPFIAPLEDRFVFQILGEDRRTFLQGLTTNTMDASLSHTGLLTPQGKILFDFFVTEGAPGFEDALLIECGAKIKADLEKRLTFYKLRAKVELSEPDPALQVYAVWPDAEALPGTAIVQPDPRAEALGFRVYVPAGTPLENTATAQDYQAHRIALGVPEGGKDYAYGDVFPHEANFDQLAGVNFKKGCYVGQEVVSRMQHKTTIRKRIVPVLGNGDLPASGCQITVDGFPIGTLGSSVGQNGLALMRLDRAEKALAKGQSLLAEEVELSLQKPDWADFDVPGTA